jgi:beta-lactamase regulating signal transducer with metallopeptidase domain
MSWLVHTVLGGDLLLLACWGCMRRVAGPARQQRLGEYGMLAALVLAVLSLGPRWLVWHLPPAAEPQPAVSHPPVAVPPPAVAQAIPLPWLPPEGEPNDMTNLLGDEVHAAVPQEPAAPADHTEEPPIHANVTPADAAEVGAAATAWLLSTLIALYSAVAGFLLLRWLWGFAMLRRLLRRAHPASGAPARLFADMAGPRPPRLLISPDVGVPFSCGLWRPTIVLPARLADSAAEEVLRWVFAHELDHLRRQDARGAMLFGLGQALYFYLPWFWWLRRRVRLCQEYLADAAAARNGTPVDYAEFLAGWAAAPALPAGVTGVSGSCSDLYWRITMLLNTPAPPEPKCPRRWALATAAGFLSLAVLAAGIGASAAPVAPKKEEPKKEEPKKEEPKKEEPKVEPPVAIPGFPDIEEMLKRLPAGVDPKHIERMRKQLEENRERMRKQLEEHRKRMDEIMRRVPGGMPGGVALPGLPGVFGRHSEGRLGARIQPPSATLIDQLELPRDQGVVVEEVTPNSAADKAGVKPHDILLELDGKPVPRSPDGVARLVEEIKADKAINAVVLRKGKRETLKGLKLPEAAARPGAGLGLFPPGGPIANPLGGGGIPAVAPAIPAGAAGGVMTTTFRNNDRFTTRHQEGSLVITVTGKVADGKTSVGEIQVQDGRESHIYESVDKVPKAYRDKVKNLLEMTEKSNVRIEIKAP